MWAEVMRRRRLLVVGLERKLREVEVVEAGEAIVRACFGAMLIDQLSDAAADLSRAEQRLERARCQAGSDLIRSTEDQICEHLHVLRAILYHCAEHNRGSRQQQRAFVAQQRHIRRRLIVAKAIATRASRREGRRSTPPS